ncbi:hypothetical protein Hanom_Chr15g01357901 [Helianthus anomalus]
MFEKDFCQREILSESFSLLETTHLLSITVLRVFTFVSDINHFTHSTLSLDPLALSLSNGVCDYGHITHWLPQW